MASWPSGCAKEVSDVSLMSALCRAAVGLYPSQFRAEFGDDIVASFDLHYKARSAVAPGRGEWRVLLEQWRDVANLATSAVCERARDLRAGGARGPEEVISVSGKYKIIHKWYFAWQCFEEGQFLENLSKEGWHFVEYTLGWYWLTKLEVPRPYEFRFERKAHLRREEIVNYLESSAAGGWEFFKEFWGWYYFRRPLVGGASDGLAEVRH